MKSIRSFIYNFPLAAGAIIVALVVGVFTINMIKPSHPTTLPELAETSATITNLTGTSGGSGVILKSRPFESLVLTNGHVCGVVKNGGFVISEKKQARVVSYRLSEGHDLCIIKVRSNLHVNTAIASEAPDSFTKAIAVGHPKLSPTIITEGHFTHRISIPVLTGIRKCEEADYQSDMGIFCVFLGGIPIVKVYEADPISATIQPGSSGSPVYNENGDIAALVFAGSGDLAYGYTVPLEYIKQFVEEEYDTLKDNTPSSEVDFSIRQMKTNLRDFCKTTTERSKQILYVCNALKRDMSIY